MKNKQKKLKLKKGVKAIILFYIFIALFTYILAITTPTDKPKSSINVKEVLG